MRFNKVYFNPEQVKVLKKTVRELKDAIKHIDDVECEKEELQIHEIFRRINQKILEIFGEKLNSPQKQTGISETTPQKRFVSEDNSPQGCSDCQESPLNNAVNADVCKHIDKNNKKGMMCFDCALNKKDEQEK